MYSNIKGGFDSTAPLKFLTMAKGKGQKKHNEAEKLELVTAICENYGTGLYTIESCVESAGIVFKTFDNWLNENPILTELYKSAKEKVKQANSKRLVNKALKEIERRIDGYTFTEEIVEGKNENGNFVATKVVRKKVKIIASDSLLMFVGKNSLNVDADALLTDTQKVEHSGEISMNITGVEIL